MLVLSRYENESIIIDNHITIVVVGIQAGRVVLGIDAPREISVHRSEVQAAIDRERVIENGINVLRLQNLEK